MLVLLFSMHCLQLMAADCVGKLTPTELKRCADVLTSKVESGSQASSLPGGWRLVKTHDPRGGPDAVSVLHAADIGNSDPSFAGLTFRCGQYGIETVLIVLEPLARGSHYPVRVKSGTTETQIEATAEQGGEVLLLSPNTTALAFGPWQSAAEVSVDIAGPSPIHGSVPTGGLSGALQALSQSCPAH
jgi:hypothetical protein